jgi:cyclic-di-AMP phosphodiesterase PgpH
MSTGNQKKTRLERVAALELPPNVVERMLGSVQRFDVLVRIALCTLAAIALWLIVMGWAPPFAFRTGFVPPRDIVSRVEFHKEDPVATKTAKEKAANQVRYIYIQDATELVRLRANLKNKLAEISNAATLDALQPDIWKEFSPPPAANVAPLTPEQQEEEYQQFRSAISDKAKLDKLEEVINSAFAPLEQKGIIDKLAQADGQGNQSEIYVRPLTTPQFPEAVQVSEVFTGDALSKLLEKLKEKPSSPEIAQRLFHWIKPKLLAKPGDTTPVIVPTLQLDTVATNKAREDAAEKVPEQFITYAPGSVLAKGRSAQNKVAKALGVEELDLLQREHQAYIETLKWNDRLSRSLAVFGMFLAMFTLSGFYILYREPIIFRELTRFAAMLAMFVAAVALAMMASGDAWRAETIPVMLFGMTVAIVYRQELALLLTAALVLIVAVVVLDGDMSVFITLMSGAATAILLVGRIRSRSKLIYVGIAAAAVAMLTELGDSILAGQPLKETLTIDVPPVGLWAVVAGFLMTGLLPFIEKAFGVLTDISLLEVGDISHPLLQELVRRAPGTYNHSINVASIAETAAESIGARGPLVRVGAYFHDIGKMLKPQYFAENQGQGSSSLHETLLPAMSRLIIVAHVKDGADLARQHHLPQPIIDFIEQHHGTTLVEYFYHRASKQSEKDPNRSEVEEHTYRYPGPKPKSKEAGVLMLADAVESASRSLVEPTPSRLEGLVHDLAMKRLLDGQFDECGLTLQDLHDMQDSLVKSLIAVYHGRVRYPEQQTA